MSNDTVPTEIVQQYAAAHAAHYTAKDLRKALELYEGVIAMNQNTNEAAYSRTQIHNIVKSVVPKQELLAAQVGLARVHLEHDGPTPVTPLASELPG